MIHSSGTGISPHFHHPHSKSTGGPPRPPFPCSPISKRDTRTVVRRAGYFSPSSALRLANPLLGLGYCQSLHAPSCPGSPPGTAEEPPLSVLIFGDHFSEVRAIPLDIPSTGACTSAPEPTAGLAAGTGCFPASPALLGPSSCGKAPLGKAALPCEERKKCQGDRDNPRSGVLWERQGWVPTFRATRTYHLSPSMISAAQPGNCSMSDNTGAAAVLHSPLCPHGGCREPPTLPLTWAGGLQTCCHGKGIQHQLHDPAQAWGDAGCSSIHRSGSTTSRPFFP